eukprot:g19564.t1
MMFTCHTWLTVCDYIFCQSTYLHNYVYRIDRVNKACSSFVCSMFMPHRRPSKPERSNAMQLAVWLLLALSLSLPAVYAASARRATGVRALQRDEAPHLLFLMADQLRFDALGAYGNGAVKTPNLDRLAKEGMLFKNAYSSTPVCTPARAALLTGQSPWKHGMLGYGTIPVQYPFELPATLASLGYRTHSIGKDHYGWNVSYPSDSPVSHGFQGLSIYDGCGTGFNESFEEYDSYSRWFQAKLPGKDPLATGGDRQGWNSWAGFAYVYEEEMHPTAWVGKEAVEFLSSYKEESPWFLKVSFHRPHSPYDPPARFFKSCRPDLFPPTAVATDGWDLVYKEDPTAKCGDVDRWCGEVPAAALEKARCGYYGNIEFVDEQIGDIVAVLKKRGWYENTYILFTSDHGDCQMDHFHWRKSYPYECSSHVPLLVRWPGKAEQTVRDQEKTAGFAANNAFMKNNDGIGEGGRRERGDKQPLYTTRGSTSARMVELRDVFPSFLHWASGLEHDFGWNQGQSLDCLLSDPTGNSCEGGWRNWLDLECAATYNVTNHWNALTDGTWKYIFIAYDGSEQLFNLADDPTETRSLAALPEYADVLTTWRQRMVDQFQKEGRGSKWVINGTLQVRVNSTAYSPYYPTNPLQGQQIFGC